MSIKKTCINHVHAKTPRGARAFMLPIVLAVLGMAAPAFAQGVITQTEQDDSFDTANETGLDQGESGIVVAYGHNADGLYGVGEGDFSGDFDFFRLTANAGQVISVDLKSASDNVDFDSFVGIYGPSGTVVAKNDDQIGRASKLSFTAVESGEYFICVSNWINVDPGNGDDGSLPANPTVPGTGYGPPGGTGGPYQVFIGLDATAPIVQFDAMIDGNPVPVPQWTRYTGQLGSTQAAVMGIANTGNAPLTITGFSFTGPDAAKFAVENAPALPVTIPVNSVVPILLRYNGDAVQETATATLDIASNDPLDVKLPLSAKRLLVAGAGLFTVRQVHTDGAWINGFAEADALLAGTMTAGSSATERRPVINYSNGGVDSAFFGGDYPYPDTAGPGDDFAVQVTGNIFVRDAGFYTFRTFADDGIRLKIDGIQVIESGNANLPSYGNIELTAGVHTLEVVHYEMGGGDQVEVLISKELGQFSSDNATEWELLEAYSPDTDEDGMPDVWETDNGLDPNSALTVDGASGNPDNDGLTNLQEFNLGTKPEDSDSDDDTLLDGVETNTAIWVSTANTGTNPLVADTDGDGLRDDVENPSQTTTGLSQPGSDPNKRDTDGDGYSDRVEVAFGSDPKVAGSVPAFNFVPLLTENFDGGALNSVYNLTTSGGGFTPAVSPTGVAANANALQITAAINSNNNSIAWNQVPSAPVQAFRLSFDFRQGADSADGVGIGLFRTGTYGTTGGNNPAAGNKNWENPASVGGFPNALTFGFAIYNTDFIRMSGPASPGTALAQVQSPFTLGSNQFHRVIITGVTNGPSGTIVSMEVIRDVNGAAAHHQIFSNVLVPGFDLPNESFRVIAGGRTGGLNTRQDIDNVKLEVVTGSAGGPTITISRINNQTVLTYSGVLQSSGNMGAGTFADVPGAASPYTVPAGAPAKMFYRARD